MTPAAAAALADIPAFLQQQMMAALFGRSGGLRRPQQQVMVASATVLFCNRRAPPAACSPYLPVLSLTCCSLLYPIPPQRRLYITSSLTVLKGAVCGTSVVGKAASCRRKVFFCISHSPSVNGHQWNNSISIGTPAKKGGHQWKGDPCSSSRGKLRRGNRANWQKGQHRRQHRIRHWLVCCRIRQWNKGRQGWRS